MAIDPLKLEHETRHNRISCRSFMDLRWFNALYAAQSLSKR